MGAWKGTKKTAGVIFNFDIWSWINLDYLKEVLLIITNTIKSLFIPAKAEIEEDFEQAVERLQISEQDLKAREKEFTKLMLIHMLFSIALFGYCMYLAITTGDWKGTLITFALTILSLIHAFKYHFWIYQIKNRKLGSSVKDWLNSKSKQE